MDENLSLLRAEIEQKTGRTPEQLYAMREKRIRDAVELRTPDQVPIFMFLPNQLFGPPKEAGRKAALYFEPDMAMGMGFMNALPAWEILDVKDKVWPGHGLSKDAQGYQAIEGEWMKADEYDLFLKDPADFNIRCWFPRVYGALQPLAKLPSLKTLYNMGAEGIAGFFASPEFQEMGKALAKAGEMLNQGRAGMGDGQEDLALLGFPAFSHFCGTMLGAPFDAISAHLRGMKGSMVDMYQRPEKLLAACEMIGDMQIEKIIPADPNKRGNPKRVGMPLWRGDKVFMSQKQFEKFYWPGLKKVMQAAIDQGYVPMPFFEAEFGNRLECLLDLPKGKVIASVQCMDARRAKEILKGHTCVMGQAPQSLRLCSLNEIGEYYRKMMRECGKGGGFMLWMMVPGQGKLEDIKAMVDSVKEAGRV
jgi:hypothetical protein